jgi:aryl-alcohol dehydrogenase-like predicted oxidoreductase
MEFRAFGRTGWKVSAISFGAWAIGGTWGKVDEAEKNLQVTNRPRLSDETMKEIRSLYDNHLRPSVHHYW